MPKYIIVRHIDSAGNMSASEKQDAAKQSNSVLKELGEQIQWVHSYITQDKIYCVYIAPTAELIEKHADMSGFPADKIAEVRALVDPTTEAKAA